MICHASHLPPLSSQKNEMFIFGLCLMAYDQLGWSIDSNPIGHPSPVKKMKCSFFHYIQHLMIGQAGQWTQIPSATPLQPKKWNAHFSITFNFWWSAGLVNRLKPHLPSLSNKKKWNTHFWITFNFWWSVGLFNGLEPHPTSPLQPKNEMLILGLRSTSDDQLGWSMDSNPIHHPSPAKNWNAHFLIMFKFWAGRWTWTPPATPLQPTKWNAHFCITFNFWWSVGLINGWPG